MKIKTSELIGAQLDWAVARSIGAYRGEYRFSENGRPDKAWIFPDGIPVNATTGKFQPSTDWSQGGPLIEKHQIELKWEGIDGNAYWWSAVHQDVAQFQLGDKPLIAAMRAIVAAKLGEEIEVPEELV